MGIQLKLAVREGWKATENSRWGEALEVRFVTDENKVIFRYCPKCNDKQFWQDVFAKLEHYDSQIKGLRHTITDIEGTQPYAVCGPCIKEENKVV